MVKAIRILEAAQIEDVTANALIVADPIDLEGQKRIASNENKRARFDFTMVDIPDDTRLVFLQDDKIVCTVTQRKPARVNFRGEELSLSKAATKASGRDSSLQGAAYWKYEDELLTDRRNRMESEEGENADEE